MRHQKIKTAVKRFCLAAVCLCLLLALLPVNACAAEKTSLDALSGKTAGVMTGTPQDEIVEDMIKDPTLLYFNSFSDIYLALQEHKVDFCVNSVIAYRIMEETYPDFAYIDQPVHVFDIGAIFPKTQKGQDLCEQLNAYIAEIKENGELDRLKKYWLYPNDWKNFKIPAQGSKGTLKMATTTSMKPFSFILNGQFAGFDIALISGFCQEYGYGLEVEDVDFAGGLSGIAAGKYDLAAGQISWTQERAESVLYSDFYCQQIMVPIVRSEDYPGAMTFKTMTEQSAVLAAEESGTDLDLDNDGAPDPNAIKDGASASAGKNLAGDDNGEAKNTFATSVAKSFRRTLLDENRWKMILSGLKVTLLITVFGFILANVLGAAFCALIGAKRKALRMIAELYSRIMQGTPIVVILMILYYIIFRTSKMPGILVSVIGFGITSGAYLAQLFHGAIAGVDPGQKEAALAIGFTRRQAFVDIVLPQAVRSMLPGYFSQLINLMKGTAIVGYIAVADLTKTGDIIRSSTYEPFFPLILVAVIYFAIACILLSILKRIQKALAPKRRKKQSEEGGSKI